MASLGNKFQTARETRGLTLEQIASKTRIQECHLRALEADAFEQLPERVFTKGFVRAYARLLELDEDECLRLFEECSASFYQKEKEDEGIRSTFLRTEDVQKERTSRVMVVLLVGGLFLLGGMVLFQLATVQQDDASIGANPEPAPETEAGETSVESAVDDGASAPAASFPDVAPASTPDSENAVLEIRTSGTTWVVIRSDEDKPREFLLQAGEVIQQQARDRFLLTLGNAEGVEVRLNGELQGPFGEAGAVVRDVELRPSRSFGILDMENPH